MDPHPASPEIDPQLPPTRVLAQFAASCPRETVPPETVPSEVMHEAVRSFLNALACAVGGARDPAVDVLWSAVSPFAGAPTASLLGRDGRTDMLTAALVNGYATNILDFDDTHLVTVIHPGPPVLAPLLALAESGTPGPVSGAALLHAFLIGMEVACRLGVALGPGHYARGWHVSATCGVVGAAAAAGRLLQLDPVRMTAALGIAATQASGLTEMLGGMSKSFNIARAGRDGLAAAQLARSGFSSSPAALEAPRGFGAVLGEGLDIAALTGDLGQRWEAADNTYKPFPCGIVLHPLIDGCLQLALDYAPPSAAIESIDLSVHPLVLRLAGRTDPQTSLEAKLSYTHAAAIVFVAGAAGVEQFGETCVGDPAVAALRAKVNATVVDTLEPDQAHVRVRLAGGRTLSCSIEHAIGSVARPMTDEALDAKFLALTTGPLTGSRARALLAACRDLRSVADVRDLVALARPLP